MKLAIDMLTRYLASIKNPPVQAVAIKGDELVKTVLEIETAITVLTYHSRQEECPMLPGENAATYTLEYAKAEHMRKQALMPSERHVRCIEQIADALMILENSRDVPARSEEPSITKTSNMTFMEALEALKRGKSVVRMVHYGGPCGQSIAHGLKDHSQPTVADIIATDWRVVE
jgi:hypothetical protein